MKKQFLILTVFVFLSTVIFAQKGFLVNNGAWIGISSGTYVSASTYVNKTNGSNHGKIILDGTLIIKGDFINEVSDVSENVFTDTTGGLGMTNGTILLNGTADQHISNTTANAYIDFENLTVNKTSGTAYVNAGSAATVEGVLDVTSGTFRLASPADGESPSGSLITNTGAASNVTGGGNLYVDRHFETNGRYQYVSMPVTNATDDLFDSGYNSDFNPNLYVYDESYDAATDPSNTNYSNWADATYAFYDAWTQVAVDGGTVGLTAGTGYITYNNIELDVNFGGSPSNLNNSASYSPSVEYHLNDANGGYYDGWNIIGNPYPCALDWDDSNWTKTNISNTIYMWDGDNGNYIYYNNGSPEDHLSGSGQTLNSDATGRYVPAMQSFFVKATGTPAVTISGDSRVHYVKDMYKKGRNNKDVDFQYIMLKTQDGDFYDETIVRFIDGTQDDFDNNYDAYKMFPNNPPVMIYSLITSPEEIPVAINSLPLERIETTIPLGFVCTNAGTYTITAEDVEFDAGTDVKLIDTYENTETTLYEGAEYTFSANAGEVRDRFYLFSVVSSSIDNPEDENIEYSSDVWSNQNNVYISIKSNKLIDANVKIYDMLGRTVIDQNVNGTYNIINIPGASGTYFVKLTGANGISKTRKVFIQK